MLQSAEQCSRLVLLLQQNIAEREQQHLQATEEGEQQLPPPQPQPLQEEHVVSEGIVVMPSHTPTHGGRRLTEKSTPFWERRELQHNTHAASLNSKALDSGADAGSGRRVPSEPLEGSIKENLSVRGGQPLRAVADGIPDSAMASQHTVTHTVTEGNARDTGKPAQLRSALI